MYVGTIYTNHYLHKFGTRRYFHDYCYHFHTEAVFKMSFTEF